MTTINQLTKAIANRFGTRAAFAKAIKQAKPDSKIDSYYLRKFIAAYKKKKTDERQKELDELMLLTQTVDKADPDADKLTLAFREKIKATIDELYGSVDKFAASKGLNRHSVYQVLTGQRATLSGPMVQKLLTILNIRP